MNTLIEELKKSFIASLSKTADILNISDVNKVFTTTNSINNKITSAFAILDEACTEFGKLLLNQTQIEEKEPEDLTLLFSGKNGGKIYRSQDTSSPLIINDETLIARDLKALSKSFYAEDYLEASKFLNLIKQKGVITLKEYRK